MNRSATGTRCWPLGGLLAAAVLLVWVGIAPAQESPTIVRVEEDWELTIGTPAPDSDAPQATCVISPLGGVEALYAAFELNQQSLPSFTAGGLQLQVWEGDVPLSDRHFPNGAVLELAGEVIRWTQKMELDGGSLTFEIVNGTSSTWGAFGGQGYLKASVLTGLSSLNSYSPAVSAENSGVSYAANRVQSLILKRVRYYTSTGDQIEDTTARVVHSQE